MDEMDAIVVGTKEYNLHLKVGGKDLEVFCSCPYFESDGPCEHLWAVLRLADHQTFLPSAEGKTLGMVAWVPPSPGGERTRPPARFVQPPPPPWKQALACFRLEKPNGIRSRSVAAWPPGRELCYIVDANASRLERQLVVNVQVRDRNKNGALGMPKEANWEPNEISEFPDAADRQIMTLLSGAMWPRVGYGGYGYRGYQDNSSRSSFALTEPLGSMVVPELCATGRFLLSPLGNSRMVYPLSLDQGGPWAVKVVVARKGEDLWGVSAVLERGEERLPLHATDLAGAGHWCVIGTRIGCIEGNVSANFITLFQSRVSVDVPGGDIQEFFSEFLTKQGLPELELPEELAFETVESEPEPALHVEQEHTGYDRKPRLMASLWFCYGDLRFSCLSSPESVYNPGRRLLVRRNVQAEQRLQSILSEAGFRRLTGYLQSTERQWEIAPKKLPAAVRLLTSRGWTVEIEGATYRQPGEINLAVSTGIDWFDLEGTVDFGPTLVTLPALLKALGRGEETVELEDGSLGLIPEDWQQRFGLLAATAANRGGAVRFRKNQALLLDALLASQPSANIDEAFRKIRDELHSFDGIRPAQQPPGFQGLLRDYQREGLSWFEFLRRFGLGGCLADDMGVGKTIQVLALLEKARAERAGGNGKSKAKPSLVVAPKSVLFNWVEEARRFTPELRVLDYSGPERSLERAAEHELVITSYGLLRRDVLKLQKVVFDYAVLDEAQNIKNDRTAVAKAARLLNADHRLALTGTPVENHLGELWSIFEFLNPGMLGSSSVWQNSGGAARNPDEEMRGVLRGALRPYILRRTKEQVASELPEKLEQTLYCELEPKQRKLYDQLRDHYRASLLGRLDSRSLARSKIQILEALLRLRQAACHPGLIDRERAGGPSAKLDALLPMLAEIIEEGHKALVFSQFTSLLSLLRPAIEKSGWQFEYLDGQTRDRRVPVERFQTDPDCPLFLISLKAGGLGLNLTAADYVFLLDPWWNPAVESQAVDRAHRIGQTRKVFAYRLIARDTVEEKVLALQRTKRDLADSIISEDNSVLRNIRREDLELLLS